MTLTTDAVLKSKVFEETEQLCIFLHGFGTRGRDFSEAVEFFMPDDLKNTVFLFPNGPFECQIGEDFEWFSLADVSYDGLRKGLEMAGPKVFDYIQQASKKYHCSNINLLGFSQGTIMSFEMLFYLEISKIVAFSGLFAAPFEKQIISKDSKVLIVHSDDDEVVPYKNVKLTKDNLSSFGISSTVFECSKIGHSISTDGWQAAFSFLKSC